MSDTLTADTTLISVWAQSGCYDYARQLTLPDRNWLDELALLLQQTLMEWEEKLTNWTPMELAMMTGGLALTVILACVLWRNRYRWAGRRGHVGGKVAYDITNDDIHGMDFDALLHRAMADEDYSEALRILYLRHLQYLSEAGLIGWELDRTPDTYVAELPPGEEREKLRMLTRAYVRVRYGHYPIDRSGLEDLMRGERGGGR